MFRAGKYIFLLFLLSIYSCASLTLTIKEKKETLAFQPLIECIEAYIRSNNQYPLNLYTLAPKYISKWPGDLPKFYYFVFNEPPFANKRTKTGYYIIAFTKDSPFFGTTDTRTIYYHSLEKDWSLTEDIEGYLDKYHLGAEYIKIYND